MFDGDFNFINEEFYAEQVSPKQLDSLLAEGWRHFGPHFFRYNLGLYEFDIRYVIPLRILLSDFTLSKSQRRTLSRNNDVEVSIEPLRIDEEYRTLFHLHKSRFRDHIPDSIDDFISEAPELLVETKQLSVHENSRLIAASYFDIGWHSLSGVYAIFDPAFSTRRLGIFTLLKEIEYAKSLGKQFYYLGYSYAGNSFYDYKKRFRGSEYYDWKRDSWKTFDLTKDENADAGT